MLEKKYIILRVQNNFIKQVEHVLTVLVPYVRAAAKYKWRNVCLNKTEPSRMVLPGSERISSLKKISDR